MRMPMADRYKGRFLKPPCCVPCHLIGRAVHGSQLYKREDDEDENTQKKERDRDRLPFGHTMNIQYKYLFIFD